MKKYSQQSIEHVPFVGSGSGKYYASEPGGLIEDAINGEKNNQIKYEAIASLGETTIDEGEYGSRPSFTAPFRTIGISTVRYSAS